MVGMTYTKLNQDDADERAAPKCDLKRELEMWLSAREYYHNRGWDDLADQADWCVSRITEQIARS